MLKPGARIWVSVPGSGYVSVGMVAQEMQSVDEFTVFDAAGNEVPIIDVSSVAASLRTPTDEPDIANYLVRVEWIKTVNPKQAVREKGFFGNQNSVARPRSPKWTHTVERLKTRFSIE